MASVQIDKYEFTGIEYKHSGYCVYTARVGCVEIATIFSPHKGKRDYYIVRLNFKQERGKVDFTKDKTFNTYDECERYIHDEFKKTLRCLINYYRNKKFKNKKPSKCKTLEKINTPSA
jgi:hypothetical protein